MEIIFHSSFSLYGRNAEGKETLQPREQPGCMVLLPPLAVLLAGAGSAYN